MVFQILMILFEKHWKLLNALDMEKLFELLLNVNSLPNFCSAFGSNILEKQILFLI